VTVAAALVFLGFALVMPFLPFYVKSLGVQGMPAVAFWSGIFLTIPPLLASILGPGWARIAERVGLKIMVQRVLITIALHWGLMYFARNVWHVLALRILLGLFSGFGTMSVALVTHGCPQSRIGRAVGALQATQILSTAFGPFLGGVLAQEIGIRTTFVVTFVLCVLGLLFVMALYSDTVADPDEAERITVVVGQAGPVSEGVRAVIPEPPATPRRGRSMSYRQILALPLFLRLMPLLFFVNLVDRALSLIVPLSIDVMSGPGGHAVATTGVVVSAGAFASAASAYFLGHGGSRLGPLRLLALSLLGGFVSIVPMAFCRSILPFAALRTLLGLSVGGAATLAYTLAGEVIPASARATGYGMLSSAAMLGGSMGPIVSGLLTSIDLRAPFLVSGLVYLALTLHATLMVRRRGRAPTHAVAARGGGRP
jgi:DHA1 family multidrug resistance protein-like MFS transporter